MAPDDTIAAKMPHSASDRLIIRKRAIASTALDLRKGLLRRCTTSDVNHDRDCLWLWACVQAPFGQLWSPATVLINWPPVAGLRSPAIEVRVIALARADMTLDDLNRAHLQAAHDVLNAAVLGLEQMTEIPSPSGKKPLPRS